MGSKYFGRAIKKWRLFAGLSQEELAERAQVSVSLVGTVERERGHLSEEIFTRICLGLERKLERPMLRSVLTDGIESLWNELLAIDRSLRQEESLAAVEHESQDVSQEDLDKTLDSTLSEIKKLALLWYRALGSRTQEAAGSPAFRGNLRPAELGHANAHKRVRVRKPGNQSAPLRVFHFVRG